VYFVLDRFRIFHGGSVFNAFSAGCTGGAHPILGTFIGFFG
jgi:hypothetical protein